MSAPLSRRAMLRHTAAGAAALFLPGTLAACDDDRSGEPGPDLERLLEWTAALRRTGLSGSVSPLGRSAVRVGELAAGTPYKPSTLEAYLRAGGSASGTEPLTLSLTHFDCV